MRDYKGMIIDMYISSIIEMAVLVHRVRPTTGVSDFLAVLTHLEPRLTAVDVEVLKTEPADKDFKDYIYLIKAEYRDDCMVGGVKLARKRLLKRLNDACMDVTLVPSCPNCGATIEGAVMR